MYRVKQLNASHTYLGKDIWEEGISHLAGSDNKNKWVYGDISKGIHSESHMSLIVQSSTICCKVSAYTVIIHQYTIW